MFRIFRKVAVGAGFNLNNKRFIASNCILMIIFYLLNYSLNRSLKILKFYELEI
jgi:hypothetical protein